MKTITTIELSNICDLECLYCINRLLVKHPDRQPGIMDDRTFDASLELLRQTCYNGTQEEVNLNGNGESTLDPKLPERIRAVKDIMGDKTVMLCSNAVGLTYDKIKSYKDAGVDRIDLSIHSFYHTRKAIDHFRKIGITGCLNYLAVVNSHNWAGQLEPEHSIDICMKAGDDDSTLCRPIEKEMGYIQKEGNVSPCCYDYKNLGVFGTVFDSDILDREIKEYELCKTCHERVVV